MPPPNARPKRRQRRVRERSLGASLAWSLAAVLTLGLIAFQAELHWPGSPLNNLWNLLVVNGQVRPDNPLIAQYLGEINRQDLVFLSYACLFGGGVTLGRLAPRSATRREVLLAAAGGTSGIVVFCLALAWALQLWLQHGHLAPHQIDAFLVATQLGWAVSWVLVYMAGTALGLRWRDRLAAAGQGADTPGTSLAAKARP